MPRNGRGGCPCPSGRGRWRGLHLPAVQAAQPKQWRTPGFGHVQTRVREQGTDVRAAAPPIDQSSTTTASLLMLTSLSLVASMSLPLYRRKSSTSALLIVSGFSTRLAHLVPAP